jgi:hypothetical protein
MPVQTPPRDVSDLIRLFGHVTAQFCAVWRAYVDGRLSRALAPSVDMEAAMIAVVEDLWRAIGETVRTGARTIAVTSSLPPARLQEVAETALRLVAFQPYLVEQGIDIPRDPELDTLMQSLLEEALAGAEAQR